MIKEMKTCNDNGDEDDDPPHKAMLMTMMVFMDMMAGTGFTSTTHTTRSAEAKAF